METDSCSIDLILVLCYNDIGCRACRKSEVWEMIITEFGKKLSEIMLAHQVSSIELCEKLNMKKSHFSKIKNGHLLSASYDMIEELSRVMSLTPEEKLELAEAFQYDRSTPANQFVSRAFNKLYAITYPTVPESSRQARIPQPGAAISGLEDLTAAAVWLCRGTETVRLLESPIYANSAFVECLFAALDEGCAVTWLVPMDKSNAGMDFLSIVNAIPALMLRNVTPCGFQTDVHSFMEGSQYCFRLITDRGMILFDKEAENGVFLNEGSFVDAERQHFDTRLAETAPFVSVYSDPIAFLQDMMTDGKDMISGGELYLLKKTPCYIMEANVRNIYEYIADFENKEQIAENYIRFLGQYLGDTTVTHDIFFEDGMEIVLQGKKMREMLSFTKEIPLELREDSLHRAVETARETDMNSYNALRFPAIRMSDNTIVNLRTNGMLLVMVDFEGKCYISVTHNKRITDMFVDYLKKLEKWGILRSKEETLQLMEQALGV